MSSETFVQRMNDRVLYHESEKASYKYGIIDENMMYKHYNFSDKVLVFFNGSKWMIVKFEIMQKCPILVYEHWSEKHNEYYTNSLVMCPITLRTMIYKGVISIDSIKDLELILHNNNTNDTFPMSNPYTGDTDKDGNHKAIKLQVKRYDVKITTLKDVFGFAHDAQYIVPKNKVNKLDIIVDDEYYKDTNDVYGNTIKTHKSKHHKLHPKSLVYIIQYYSKSKRKYKRLMLVSDKANNKKITGYTYTKYGVKKYMEDNQDIIVDKRGFVYPMLAYTVKALYKDVEYEKLYNIKY